MKYDKLWFFQDLSWLALHFANRTFFKGKRKNQQAFLFTPSRLESLIFFFKFGIIKDCKLHSKTQQLLSSREVITIKPRSKHSKTLWFWTYSGAEFISNPKLTNVSDRSQKYFFFTIKNTFQKAVQKTL